MEQVHAERRDKLERFLASYSAFDYSANEISRRMHWHLSTTLTILERLRYQGVIVVTRRYGLANQKARAMYQLSSWLQKDDREAQRIILYQDYFKPGDLLNEQRI